MGREFVNLDNARHDDQRRVMEGIIERGECPFDEENLAKTHDQPILRQGDHWTVTTNQWPYAFTRSHLLAISRYHAETLSDLKEGSFAELQEHFQWAEQELHIAAGGLAMRFGDIKINAATVNHLHVHLIEPTQDKKPEDKVRFKIG